MKTASVKKYLGRYWLIMLACALYMFAGQSIIKAEENSDYFNSSKYNKWKNSTNFVAGLKALDENDDENDYKVAYLDAIAFFDKEIALHPANGYAYCNKAQFQHNLAVVELNNWIVAVFYTGKLTFDDTDEMGKEYDKKKTEIDVRHHEAVVTLDKGIALLPSQDKDNLYKAYMLKAEILSSWREPDSAQVVDAYRKAIVINPVKESYYELLDFYTNRGDIRDAVSIVMEMNKVFGDDNDESLMLFTAAAHYENADYDKALEVYNKILKLNPKNETALSNRVDVYLKQGKYNDCVDEAIKLADKGVIYDVSTRLLEVCEASDESVDMVFEKVNQAKVNDSEENPTNWNVVEGYLYIINKNDYQKGIECLKTGLKQTYNPAMLAAIGRYYYLLGKVDNALQWLDDAFTLQQQRKQESDEEDDTATDNEDYLAKKIEIEMNCGLVERVITDAQIYRLVNGDEANINVAFPALIWAYLAKGNYKECIDICDKWLEVSDGQIYPMYRKAYALSVMGRNDEAQAILQEIFSDESNFLTNNDLKLNVLLRMGRTSEAREILETLAENSRKVQNMTAEDLINADVVTETMESYNLACYYSLLGDKEKALDYLRQHFEECNDSLDPNFDYAILDYDFDNIRQMPEFMQLINEYKTKWLNGEFNKKK